VHGNNIICQFLLRDALQSTALAVVEMLVRPFVRLSVCPSQSGTV